FGCVPLVRGAHDLVVAFVGPATAAPRSANRGPGCVPPTGLWPYMFEVLGRLTFLFSERFKPKPPGGRLYYQRAIVIIRIRRTMYSVTEAARLLGKQYYHVLYLLCTF